MQSYLVGNGKSGWVSAQIYGAVKNDIPTVGIWRPLDEADRFMGYIYSASQSIQALGGCSE